MYKISAFYAQLAAGVAEEGLPDVKAALEAGLENGIEAVEFCYDEIDENTAELLRSVGMKTSSVHGFMPLEFKTDALYNASFKKMREALDKAVALGSPFFMGVPQPPADMTPDMKPAFVDAVRAQFANLCDYAKNKPLTVTVEDFSTDEVPYATYGDIDFLLENNPSLMFTYDTGNFPLAGNDLFEGLKRYADRIVYVHLKDLKITDESDPSPIIRGGVYYDSLNLGGGFIDNVEAIKQLKAIGYTDGYLTIEVNAMYDRLSRTISSVKWLKEALKKI